MIEKNETYELNITGTGSEGEGVGRIDGMTVFVPDALLGETVKVLIVKALKTYAYGKIVKIINPSPERTDSECPYYKQCGGCTMQHCTYAYELKFKTQKVRDCIERIAGIDTPVYECIGSESIAGYRNKAIFPVTAEGIGFFAPRSHRVTDMDSCIIQSRVTDEVIRTVRTFMHEYKVSPYNEASHTGIIRNIFVRCGVNTGEIMVAVVTRTEKLPHSNELVEMLCDAVKPVSIIQNINPDKTNVALGNKSVVLYGRDFITDTFGKLKYEISLNSFYQVNPTQMKTLYDKVVDFAEFDGTERVFDLYCGAGTISLYIAEYVKEVVGVEVVPQAIENARRNAEINNIENVTFHTGKSEAVAEMLGDADVVIVDPPRKGCDAELLKTINNIAPKKLIYVSCNPATLARDMKILTEYGFKTEKIQPVDMFPRTIHVETVVLMSKKEKHYE